MDLIERRYEHLRSLLEKISGREKLGRMNFLSRILNEIESLGESVRSGKLDRDEIAGELERIARDLRSILEESKERYCDYLILVTRSSDRRSLMKMGVDGGSVIATGGPITEKHLRELVGETKLGNAMKRAERARRAIRECLERSGPSRILVITRKGERADDLLYESVLEFSKEIGIDIDIERIEIEDIEELAELIGGISHAPNLPRSHR